MGHQSGSANCERFPQIFKASHLCGRTEGLGGESQGKKGASARGSTRFKAASRPIREARGPEGAAPCGRMSGYEHSRLGRRSPRSEHLQMSPGPALVPPSR